MKTRNKRQNNHPKELLKNCKLVNSREKFSDQPFLPGIPRRPPGTDSWGACAKLESMERADVGIPRWRLLWGCGACNDEETSNHNFATMEGVRGSKE